MWLFLSIVKPFCRITVVVKGVSHLVKTHLWGSKQEVVLSYDVLAFVDKSVCSQAITSGANVELEDI
jgi:hypothetical protein